MLLKKSACMAGLGSFLQSEITLGSKEAERRNKTQLLNLTIQSWKMTKKKAAYFVM